MASTSFYAESTHHRFSLLEAGLEENTRQVERVELFGDHAFVLRNFLSVAECNDVIGQAEAWACARLLSLTV